MKKQFILCMLLTNLSQLNWTMEKDLKSKKLYRNSTNQY